MVGEYFNKRWMMGGARPSLGDLRWVQSWDRSWALEMDEVSEQQGRGGRQRGGVVAAMADRSEAM